jgi:hypothetical protein
VPPVYSHAAGCGLSKRNVFSKTQRLQKKRSALNGVGALKSLMPIAAPTFARQNQINDQGQQCKNHKIKELGFIYHMTSITPSDVD